MPLYLVTGAPASGKSTLVRLLAGELPATAVLDTDLFGPWSNPDWEAWANSWFLLAHGLAQSALKTVLVGYGISRSKATAVAASDLVGPLRVLHLHLDPGVVRERLEGRGTYDNARIERKLVAATTLAQEADETLDVTNMTPTEVSQRVLRWLSGEVL